MTFRKTNKFLYGHRTFLLLVLCLFGLCVAQSHFAPRSKKKVAQSDRIYLEHADELKFDDYVMPGVQVVKGRVAFRHQNVRLTCDSAYFRQDDNSFEAFGHVHMVDRGRFTLNSKYAYYDGMDEMVRARRDVVLHHRGAVLYCDSLDYDRKYEFGYFFEGGKLVDGKNTLVSDWGEYSTKTRQATFYYGVRLRSPKYDIHTDTLHYDTNAKLAHVTGPSTIYNQGNVVKTENGYYDTERDRARLFGRSTVTSKDGNKTIVADSLYSNSKTGISEAFHNAVYTDKKDKHRLTGDYCYYNEKTGAALATRKPTVIDFSQKDTLYMHSDTILMRTYHLNTDSVYRKVFCYRHVRAFRTDVQAVCDSLVFNTKDSCLTMYRDPIVWNADRQLLGEEIKVYMRDSTIKWSHVIGQALSVELMPDKKHYNQIASTEMKSFFNEDGSMKMTEAISNVRSVYYPVDDKDSSLIGLNYAETDTMRMFMNKQRKLEKIWMPKADLVIYPITQIPPGRDKLDNFAWFDYVRPLNKDDIYEWRGKASGTELKVVKRQAAPLQHLNFGKASTAQPALVEKEKDTPVSPPKVVKNAIKPPVKQ